MSELIERYSTISILSRELEIPLLQTEPAIPIPQHTPGTDGINEMSLANEDWLDEAIEQALEEQLIEDKFSLSQFMDEGNEVIKFS